MVKNDYTKFSNIKETVKDEVIQNGVIDTTEEEPEVIDEVVKPEVVGVIIDCMKLNVRKTPNPYGEIIGTIDVDSEVTINDAESTNEFYKICTAAGVEGFCVKKFIQVK